MTSTFSYLPFTPYSICKFFQIYTYIYNIWNYIQLVEQNQTCFLGPQVLLHDVATPYVEPMLAAVLRQAEAEFDVEAWEMESGV